MFFQSIYSFLMYSHLAQNLYINSLSCLSMNTRELLNFLAAIIILTLVLGFAQLIEQDFPGFAEMFGYSVIILVSYVYSRKFFAHLTDCGVEHSIWSMERLWFRDHDYFKNPLTKKHVFFRAGIIL